MAGDGFVVKMNWCSEMRWAGPFTWIWWIIICLFDTGGMRNVV